MKWFFKSCKLTQIYFSPMHHATKQTTGRPMKTNKLITLLTESWSRYDEETTHSEIKTTLVHTSVWLIDVLFHVLVCAGCRWRGELILSMFYWFIERLSECELISRESDCSGPSHSALTDQMRIPTHIQYACIIYIYYKRKSNAKINSNSSYSLYWILFCKCYEWATSNILKIKFIY